MTDKLDEFMKKHSPPAEGALKKLELPGKKNWIMGLAASGVLAASLALVVTNNYMKYEALIEAEEALEANFEDELDEELFMEEL